MEFIKPILYVAFAIILVLYVAKKNKKVVDRKKESEST